jgi:hypothetical protein
MAYQATQSWKKSAPEKVDGTWRIRRHDGELVGFYATKQLAQRAIDTQGWFQ